MVYVFAGNKPRVIQEYMSARMIRSIERLNKTDGTWQHYLWTNDLGSIPQELKNIKNIKLMELTEFKDHVLYPDILEKISSSELSGLVQSSDIIRLIAVTKYGGIYHDCDSEIFRAEDLYILMKNFDFIAGEEPNDFDRRSNYKVVINSIPNSFFASSPHHPMLTEAVNLMKRNLHKKEPLPNYVKHPKDAVHKIFFETGQTLFTVSYFKYVEMAKQNGWQNNSIVLPPMGLFNTELARAQLPYNKNCLPKDQSNKVPDFQIYEGMRVDSIAGDMLCGVWVKEIEEKH
jgi:hypothetical protein